MAMRKISSDLLAMFIASIAFTVLGAVTGATFFVILCGACLALTTLEVVTTLRRPAPGH
jgi:hypothetical protein